MPSREVGQPPTRVGGALAYYMQYMYYTLTSTVLALTSDHCIALFKPTQRNLNSVQQHLQAVQESGDHSELAHHISLIMYTVQLLTSQTY